MSGDWVLKLVTGTLIVGTVDDQNAQVVEVRNPRKLREPFSWAGSNVSSMVENEYFKDSVIYVERTAIVFWAKPSERAYGR